jgi:hypothetical protein
VAVLGVVRIICAVFGVAIAPGEPIVARSATALTYGDLHQVRADLLDQQSFAREVAVDCPIRVE